MAGALTRLARTRWLGVRTPQSRTEARDAHVEIVAAIAARDADGAVALTVAHNRGTSERLLGYLTEERRRLRGRGFSIIESAARPAPLRAVRPGSVPPAESERASDVTGRAG